jgi:hypothetical protein
MMVSFRLLLILSIIVYIVGLESVFVADSSAFGFKGVRTYAEDEFSDLLPPPFADAGGVTTLPLGMKLQNLQLHGTTTLSYRFSKGIIVAADSRASMGQYVSSRTVKKIIPITK